MAQKIIKIDEEQHKKLSEIKDKSGIPLAEQVRRALEKWINDNHLSR